MVNISQYIRNHGTSLIATSIALSVGSVIFLEAALRVHHRRRHVSTQPHQLSKSNDYPYQPDDVNAEHRIVETQYGPIQIFEWGPEDGKKVIFLHGISTPCIAFKGIAEELVHEGCRVILYGT